MGPKGALTQPKGALNQPKGALNQPVVALSLLFAIPDHPWVDTVEGAAVRIAMTVGAAGQHPGELRTATTEAPQEDGSSAVGFTATTGKIAADLTTGADVAGATALRGNDTNFHN